MNWIDIVIILIVAFSAVISIIRGFVKEAISLVTWSVAFWVALNFCSSLATFFDPHIQSAAVRLGLSFIIIFVSIILIGLAINFICTSIVKKSGLTNSDRIVGVAFGAARGVLLVALLVLMGEIAHMQQRTWWQQSSLIPRFEGIVQWMYEGSVPKYISTHFVIHPPRVQDVKDGDKS